VYVESTVDRFVDHINGSQLARNHSPEAVCLLAARHGYQRVLQPAGLNGKRCLMRQSRSYQSYRRRLICCVVACEHVIPWNLVQSICDDPNAADSDRFDDAEWVSVSTLLEEQYRQNGARR
jgi:hypothetical protein